jgi:hypothetical protein
MVVLDQSTSSKPPLDIWPFAPRDPQEFAKRYGERPPF